MIMAQTGAFEMVDAKAYARRLTEAGAPVVTAAKRQDGAGSVLARPAVPGERLTVWTQDGNNEGLEIADEGDVVVTRVDKKGRPVLNKDGNPNTWKMAGDTFKASYDTEHPDPETGAYIPTGGPRRFVQVGKDISFDAHWGGVQNIRKGGYLNITNPDDVFGIAREEFLETYQLMNIGTERLVLYPISDGSMRRLIDDETDPTLKQAYAEMLQGCLDHPADRLWYAVWFLELKARPGTVIGDLSFKGVAPDGMAEIGYGLREGFCGRGYMTEAVKAIVAWALTQQGVTRVEAETDPDNTASQKVLSRAGFIPTGTAGEEGPRFVYVPSGNGSAD